MVFDITYILNLRTKYTKIDLPNDFTLFLEEYVRKQGDLKRNQYSHTHNTNKQSKVYYKSHKQNKVQRIISEIIMHGIQQLIVPRKILLI